MHADHFSWFNTGDLSVNGCHNNNHIAPLNTTLRWSLRDFSNLSIRGRGHCPSSLTVANGCRHSWQVKPFTMAAWWWPSLGDWLFDSILPLSPQLCRIVTDRELVERWPEVLGPCYYTRSWWWAGQPNADKVIIKVTGTFLCMSSFPLQVFHWSQWLGKSRFQDEPRKDPCIVRIKSLYALFRIS